MEVELPNNPDNQELGTRVLHTKDSFYIDSEDKKLFKEGRIIRLKDLYNVEVEMYNKSAGIWVCKYAENQEVDKRFPKIQWVPTHSSKDGEMDIPGLLEPSPGKINKKSLKRVRFKVEHNIQSIKDGEIVHFERIGFAKLSRTENKITGHLVHD